MAAQSKKARGFRALLAEISARDVAAFVGLSLMAGGLWFVYWPAALIAPGAALFWLAARG